jgi:hypothetical protein
MKPEPTTDTTLGYVGAFIFVAVAIFAALMLACLDHEHKAKRHSKLILFASNAMVVARTLGPQVTQPVLYQDAGTGLPILGFITGVNSNGTVTLVTFPPNAASANQTSVRYDYTGAVGTWRYSDPPVV